MAQVPVVQRQGRRYGRRPLARVHVRWPEYTLEPEQRISERRETYHARFSVDADADGGEREYVTELDEATWRTLEVGLKCRLKVSGFSDEVKQVTPLRG